MHDTKGFTDSKACCTKQGGQPTRQDKTLPCNIETHKTGDIRQAPHITGEISTRWHTTRESDRSSRGKRAPPPFQSREGRDKNGWPTEVYPVVYRYQLSCSDTRTTAVDPTRRLRRHAKHLLGFPQPQNLPFIQRKLFLPTGQKTNREPHLFPFSLRSFTAAVFFLGARVQTFSCREAREGGGDLA